jgi:elongator complex protein 3
VVRKPGRSLSGVAVVAVMAPMFECPGECLFCFRGDIAAQSYTGLEPSARRAIRHHYNPYAITLSRLKQLERNGHPTDKLDVIVMGGTFNAAPREFQERFVRRLFDACNGHDAHDVREALALNESAAHRVIGLTFETRPDWATLEELNWFLELGGTRLEMGVQHTADDVLELNRRGHGVAESMRATRDARDLGFKVNHHVMPGLPGSSPDRDLQVFRDLFSEKLMPDMVKIYPTIVVPGSELAGLREKGLYEPMTDEQVVSLLARAKSLVPPWVRVMRVQRDVPMTETVGGVSKGNLRELVWAEMKKLNLQCRCVRCREVRSETGLQPELVERRYRAGGAGEVFLSFEDKEKDKLVGLLRLRLLERALRPELDDAAVVRELRVFGPEARIGARGVWQHRGFGRKLMARAEEIASANYKKLAVISGAGVRPYFGKLGYKLEGPYMVKTLQT